ncbi:Nn.00g036690.m01.CDS01 [Neocucurbitaria sp. VM-36]
MRARSIALQLAARLPFYPRPQWRSLRPLTTLAIETSCDDTSVAIVEKGVQHGRTVARLHFHKKVTSDNSVFQGVHPLVSLQSHQENLAILVNEAIDHLPREECASAVAQGSASALHAPRRRLPDFISVTRGPGMRSNLFTGLDTAKGLAVAWQKPLVGVHHMQAHALTPRLVSALEAEADSYPKNASLNDPPKSDSIFSPPNYPFLSVLASGGHTLLIHSASLTDHRVLGSTNDIAIGECLDKVARVILPPEILRTTRSTMYGSLLEDYAFGDTWHEDAKVQVELQARNENPSPWSTLSTPGVPSLPVDHASAETYCEMHSHRYKWYKVASNHEVAMQRSATKWGWGFIQPLTKAGGGTKINSLEMSFSGLMTAVERVVRYGMNPTTKKLNKTERAAADISAEERKDIAREAMRAAFEHVASRVVLGLQSLHSTSTTQSAVVLAGGVAANSFLRHILASTLCAHGYSDVQLHFPPPKFCTDNAAMIAWAGLEMFEAGHTDPLTIRAIRKWPLDRLLDPPNDG